MIKHNCIFFGLLILIQYVSFSCSSDVSANKNEENSNVVGVIEKEVKLVTWNVQTFFDSTKHGTEYAEYQKSDLWNQEKYEQRLDRLCSVLLKLDADVYALEEIENQDIIYDISNRLQGKSWKTKNKWNYACFTKMEGTAIGVAVISKYPIIKVTSHVIDIRVQEQKQPAIRPILHCTLQVKDASLEVFVNHWKSKSGGQEETEIWRDWQENVLARLITENNNSIVVCGDFNRDCSEFICGKDQISNRSCIILRGIEQNTGIINTLLYSTWLDYGLNKQNGNGSYFYNGKWEQIDNIFYNSKCWVSNFCVCNLENLITEEGIPNHYKIYTGSGYSDHLPLQCTIHFN